MTTEVVTNSESAGKQQEQTGKNYGSFLSNSNSSSGGSYRTHYSVYSNTDAYHSSSMLSIVMALLTTAVGAGMVSFLVTRSRNILLTQLKLLMGFNSY